MTLEPGSRLGPYEIVSLLGKGGMGEVYRAHDPRLERDVAIKVLPDRLSADDQFRRRLEREAKTISQLQHPHVCTLHDIGSDSGHEFLVMELLAGETLEDKLGGGALPLAALLEIGGQIAEGIDAAHRRGVAHRDLKPGNVMLTPSGAKVLDFGLAKGLEPGPLDSDTQSETATQLKGESALTSEGSIVGTLYYMAPEQLEGKQADTRSDIFALGVMLYEMATGERPFGGDSQASLIASILTSSPEPISTRTPELPSRLGWVVERCLDKNPERRWQSARDIAIELEGVETERAGQDSPATAAGNVGPKSRSLRGLAMLAAGTLLGAALAVFFTGASSKTPDARASDEWTTSTLQLEAAPYTLDLSTDGRHLLHGTSQGFYLRDLRSPTSSPLPDTQGLGVAFLAPNEDQFVFVTADDRLQLRSLSGGSLAEELVAAGAGFIGQDGLLYYTTYDRSMTFQSVRMWRRPLRGSESQAEALAYGYGHKGGLLAESGKFYMSGFEDSGLPIVQLLDLETKQLQPLFPGSTPHFLAPDLLIHFSDSALFASRVDLGTFLPIGSPRLIEDDVRRSRSGGVFTLSRGGDLIYSTGASRDKTLVWVSRTGEILSEVRTDVENVSYPNFSPDGRSLSVAALVDPNVGSTQWRLELGTGAWRQVVQPATVNSSAQWIGSSGNEVIFASNREARDELTTHVFIEPADGSAPAERLTESEEAQWWLDVSPDGRYVLYQNLLKPGLLRLDRQSGETTVLSSAIVRSARFHPQGRWIAYAARDSERLGIWVLPIDDSEGALRLTEGPDDELRWSANGEELYYRGPSHIMSIPVAIERGRLEAGRPQALFEDTFDRTLLNIRGPNWAVHPDGRFLFIQRSSQEAVVYIQNWKAKVLSILDTADASDS